MADYKHAIAKILLTEGGYVNDADDAGGETYKGISRKFWPMWKGWVYVDFNKARKDFTRALQTDKNLQSEVYEFYKENFWDKIGGDNQEHGEVASLILDSAVNEGVFTAVKRAQKITGFKQTGLMTHEFIYCLNRLV